MNKRSKKKIPSDSHSTHSKSSPTHISYAHTCKYMISHDSSLLRIHGFQMNITTAPTKPVRCARFCQAALPSTSRCPMVTWTARQYDEIHSIYFWVLFTKFVKICTLTSKTQPTRSLVLVDAIENDVSQAKWRTRRGVEFRYLFYELILENKWPTYVINTSAQL